MKSGFVNIFGRPNAGKSTLLNALMGEKLAIVSPKVQTTRHRIKAILTEPNYQIIFSDTPGIIEPKYKLHEKMMQSVKSALEDSDLSLLILDINDDWEMNDLIFKSLRIKSPSLLIINKIDTSSKNKINNCVDFFSNKPYIKNILKISAVKKTGIDDFLKTIVALLPNGVPYYSGDNISDLPTKFFVSELIREQIYELAQDEIPYHTAILIREFKEKDTLVKIVADIIVHRETQKVILIGERGMMVKKIGTSARKEIETFLDRKVFLELFIKVKPKWRNSDLYLKEYGYGAQ